MTCSASLLADWKGKAMRKAPKQWPAKIGTQPGVVIVRGGSRPAVGKVLTFRKASPGEPWMTGVVDAIRSGDELVLHLL